MGLIDKEANRIHARIVYYGASGSGKTANIELVHRKLKKDHRRDLQLHESDGEPAAKFESLPVQLGQVRGFETSIELSTVPGRAEYAEERRQLLEDVDGVIFVADLRPDHHADSEASLEELRANLASAGRSLDDVVLVVQYNHRDGADENALDALHKALDIKPAAHFEAIAAEGTGVLKCLTTVAKLALAKVREEGERAGAAETAEPELVEADVVSESEASEPSQPLTEVSADSPGFRVESAGAVEGEGRELRIPLRLVAEESGQVVEFSLRLTLDS